MTIHTMPAGTLTSEEYQQAIQCMQAIGGSFVVNLGKAWQCADNGNRAKLEQVFSDVLIDYATRGKR